jgi:hypothetical protein
MGAVMQRVISMNVGQLLLGFTEAFIGFQIQHDASAFAFGIGEKLFFFGGQRFRGKNISRFKFFRNPFLCAGGGGFPTKSAASAIWT